MIKTIVSWLALGVGALGALAGGLILLFIAVAAFRCRFGQEGADLFLVDVRIPGVGQNLSTTGLAFAVGLIGMSLAVMSVGIHFRDVVLEAKRSAILAEHERAWKSHPDGASASQSQDRNGGSGEDRGFRGQTSKSE